VISVVVVDDHSVVRDAFTTILDAQPDIEVVGEADDGAMGVEVCTRLDPDVVLMDVQMPRMDGLEATRLIAASGGHTRVVILTTFDLDEYVMTALRAGASGFILKDTTRDDLVRAVRTVAAGHALLGPTVTRRLIEEFARAPYLTSFDTTALARLTAREREVLELIAAGLSNAEIATQLVVAQTTVKSHVGSVLMKLGLRDRVHAVIYAYQAGVVSPS
jgi:DNA-binding NarL/FixJ family response regulator